MAEHPFWDDECLRGSIDRVALPPPPTSLFDHDLFCYEDDIDNLPPLADHLPPLPPQSPVLHLNPVTPSPNQSPRLLRIPPSPVQPWRSFMDDNCPLRKRVKVTITHPPRKRDASHIASPVKELQPAPPTKKRKLSPVRNAPRRLQTTLRLPTPGDPTPRLALQIPTLGKSSTRSVLSRKLASPQPQRRVSRPALQQRRCINGDLNARLKTMKTQRRGVSSQLPCRLPLVDVAVQAVSRAAQAYRQALSRVTSLPSASAGIVKTKQGARIIKERGGRKRKGKNGRTLLSFDDKEVAPLSDERRGAETSALLNYLHSQSAWQAGIV